MAIDLREQATDSEVSDAGAEIVFDGGKRRPEEAGLGHIIEADHEDARGT